jgi:acetyl-CoA carboxylase biotin carboxyl carrier protein
MNRNEIDEIDLHEGDQRIRLRRNKPTEVAVPTPAVSLPAPSASLPAAPEKKLEKPARALVEIKSPGVGEFYAQKEPGAPPFVTVGSRVTPTTTVCVVVAMKVHNDITAGCSGVITEILVKDRDFVEYGTVLFRVDPAG